MICLIAYVYLDILSSGMKRFPLVKYHYDAHFVAYQWNAFHLHICILDVGIAVNLHLVGALAFFNGCVFYLISLKRRQSIFQFTNIFGISRAFSAHMNGEWWHISSHEWWWRRHANVFVYQISWKRLLDIQSGISRCYNHQINNMLGDRKVIPHKYNYLEQTATTSRLLDIS